MYRHFSIVHKNWWLWNCGETGGEVTVGCQGSKTARPVGLEGLVGPVGPVGLVGLEGPVRLVGREAGEAQGGRKGAAPPDTVATVIPCTMAHNCFFVHIPIIVQQPFECGLGSPSSV